MSTTPAPARVVALVSGRVQGVGFRWWASACARELDLAGSATNLLDGRVEVVAEGRRDDCETLVRRMYDGAAPGRVTHVEVRWEDPQGLARFSVG
jgi:acylphosphatase